MSSKSFHKEVNDNNLITPINNSNNINTNINNNHNNTTVGTLVCNRVVEDTIGETGRNSGNINHHMYPHPTTFVISPQINI
jgi:hypothetical protein